MTTVKEFIKELRKFPQDHLICFDRVSEETYHNHIDITVNDGKVRMNDENGNYLDTVYPGYVAVTITDLELCFMEPTP